MTASLAETFGDIGFAYTSGSIEMIDVAEMIEWLPEVLDARIEEIEGHAFVAVTYSSEISDEEFDLLDDSIREGLVYSEHGPEGGSCDVVQDNDRGWDGSNPIVKYLIDVGGGGSPLVALPGGY